MKLDEIDRKILFALDINAEMNHKLFAQELGITRQALNTG
jgi:DNA-binding Lrp family transcriptional regulator